jgi:hypothetical protein
MTRVRVVVPYRESDPQRAANWAWVCSWWKTYFPDWPVTIADSGHEPFNRGASRNQAMRLASEPVLIIADADTIPDADAVARGAYLVDSGQAPWVIPYDGDGRTREGRYYNLSETATKARLRFPPDRAVILAEPWDTDDYEHKLCSWAGCLIVRTVDAYAAGGYPEFPEWGYEDDCFRTALDMVAGHHQRVHGFALHLWHPVTEGQRFGNPQIEANREVFMQYKKARTQKDLAAVIAEHGGLAS